MHALLDEEYMLGSSQWEHTAYNLLYQPRSMSGCSMSVCWQLDIALAPGSLQAPMLILLSRPSLVVSLPLAPLSLHPPPHFHPPHFRPLFQVTSVQGEYQISKYATNAAANIQNHRNTFITESDWSYLASKGVNTVRIPVGYWIAQGSTPDPPFVGGGEEVLDGAFNMAGQWGV